MRGHFQVKENFFFVNKAPEGECLASVLWSCIAKWMLREATHTSPGTGEAIVVTQATSKRVGSGLRGRGEAGREGEGEGEGAGEGEGEGEGDQERGMVEA